MAKERADRTTVTEVDRRVSAVAHDVVVTRERMSRLERENERLKAGLLAVAPKIVPDGYHITAAGDVFDNHGKPAGIIDKGRHVMGVPHECSVNADGDVIPPPGKPWERLGWSTARIGFIAQDGHFADEREQRDAESLAYHQRETEEAADRRLASTIAHNVAAKAEHLNPSPDVLRTIETVRQSHSEHRDFLRANRVGKYDGGA